jgi:hypothetical protein
MAVGQPMGITKASVPYFKFARKDKLMPAIEATLADAIEFEHTQGAAEVAEMNDLKEFHTALLDNSPTYARSLAKAASTDKVIVKISNTFGQAGATRTDDARHIIEINPTAELRNPSLRKHSSSGDRKSESRLSLVFEMQNAASSRQFDAIDSRARSGAFELTPTTSFSEADKKLMRNNRDRGAVQYARETERQEWKNVFNLKSVEQEMIKAGMEKPRDTLEYFQFFEDHFSNAVDKGHAHQYLDQYDQLKRRGG